jgi:hypothetical protein
MQKKEKGPFVYQLSRKAKGIEVAIPQMEDPDDAEMKKLIKKITNLGFSEKQAKIALTNSKGKLEEAVELLTDEDLALAYELSEEDISKPSKSKVNKNPPVKSSKKVQEPPKKGEKSPGKAEFNVDIKLDDVEEDLFGKFFRNN